MDPAPKTACTILLAEPDDLARADLTRVLIGAGFGVIAMPLGRLALDVIETTHVDAVVTEAFLPDIDGLELVRTLRQAGHTLPVVGITAGIFDRPDIYLRAMLTFGATATLAKPFPISHLVTLLTGLCAGRCAA